MSEKKETTTTTSTPKKRTAKKAAKKTATKKVETQQAVLWMGPYVGNEVEVNTGLDEIIRDNGEYGPHKYVRTNRGENDKVIFEWRGPVDNN